MNKTTIQKRLSLLLCAVLIAAMALMATGCNDTTDTVTDTQVNTASVTQVGTGKTVFDFTVVAQDGTETKFQVATDKTTVGEALLENNLIAGEQGDYGLYVKTVNGITADYETNGTYWAFYVDGQYAASGVDTTAITAGSSYAFKVEK